MDDMDQRIKCWAYGVRLQESVGFLLRSAQMAEEIPAENTEQRGVYAGIMVAQVRNIDKLLQDAESCGVGANGFLSGEFVGVRDAVNTSRSAAFDAVKRFSRELHEAALNEITGNTE